MLRASKKFWGLALPCLVAGTVALVLVSGLALRGLSRSAAFRDEFGLPLRLAESARVVRAGRTSDLGRPGIYPARRDDGVWLVNRRGRLYALDRSCARDGCATDLGPAEDFACPCCGSRYDGLGRAAGGPATEPLRRFGVSEERGTVLVDRSVAYGEDRWASPGAWLDLRNP